MPGAHGLDKSNNSRNKWCRAERAAWAKFFVRWTTTRSSLLPNVNVEVRILVHEEHGALVVPRAAVAEDKGQHYVFVLWRR